LKQQIRYALPTQRLNGTCREKDKNLDVLGLTEVFAYVPHRKLAGIREEGQVVIIGQSPCNKVLTQWGGGGVGEDGEKRILTEHKFAASM